MILYVGKNTVGCTYDVHNKPSTVMSVYECGWQISPNSSQKTPELDHFLIHYVVKGKGIFNFRQKVYHVQAGQGFLITPGEFASYAPDPDEFWEYYWVGFNGTEARNMLDKAKLSEESPIFTYDKDEKVKECLKQICHFSHLSGSKEYAMIGYLYLFFSCIATPKIQKSKAKEEYLQKAAEYIENNCFYRLTVQDVVQHVGVEHSYLFRIFKEKMGCSISDYILNRKMVKAKNFLAKSSMPITEIANSLSFSSVAHFSKIFKKVTTVSPTTYRKMFSKSDSLEMDHLLGSNHE